MWDLNTIVRLNDEAQRRADANRENPPHIIDLEDAREDRRAETE